MKKKYVMYNGIALVLFNIVFWMCTYYPRHVIDHSSDAFVATTINLSLFLVHFFLVFNSFCSNATLFEKNFLRKDIKIYSIVIKFILLLVLQLLFELLVSVLETSNCLNFSTVSNLFVVAHWIICYLILTYGNGNKIQISKTLVVILVSVIIISVVCVFVDWIMISAFQNYSAKYREDSNQINVIKTNYQFLHSIVTLIYDSFIACMLVFFHASSIKKLNDYESKFDNFVVSRAIVRICVMIMAAIVIISVKGIIFPYSSFKSIETTSATSRVNTMNNRFHKDIYISGLYRVNDKGDSKQCFVFKKVILLCDNKKTGYYITPWTDEAEVFVEYEVDGNDVYVFGNRAICYTEDDIPNTVLFADIHKCTNNSIITEVCKSLINEGNVVAFEYAAEYLCKYAPDFIVPYINRYSNGDFNESELIVFNKVGYRKEYISFIAKSLQ